MQVENNNNVSENTTKKALKVVVFGGKYINTLIDSGSGVNLITDECVRDMGIQQIDDNLVLSGLGLSKVRSYGKFYSSVVVDDFKYDNVVFHIVPQECMPYKMILGQEFLKNVVMIMREGVVYVLPNNDDEWLVRVNCVTTDLDVAGHIEDPFVRAEVSQVIQDYICLTSHSTARKA